MNERIRLLADQASHQSPDGYPVTIPYSKDFAEKFAELIVLECIQNIRDNIEIAKVDTMGDKDLFLETLRTAGHFYITELEQHFGVEE